MKRRSIIPFIAILALIFISAMLLSVFSKLIGMKIIVYKINYQYWLYLNTLRLISSPECLAYVDYEYIVDGNTGLGYFQTKQYPYSIDYEKILNLQDNSTLLNCLVFPQYVYKDPKEKKEFREYVVKAIQVIIYDVDLSTILLDKTVNVTPFHEEIFEVTDPIFVTIVYPDGKKHLGMVILRGYIY